MLWFDFLMAFDEVRHRETNHTDSERGIFAALKMKYV